MKRPTRIGTRIDVLAIDPGSSMGYAALSEGRVIHGLAIHGGERGERLASFMGWLTTNMPTEALVIERPHGVRGRAIDSLFGMLGIAQALCFEGGVSFVPVSPAAVKKAATGNGRADKCDMVAWAEAKYGKMQAHDEADALGIMEWWLKR